MSNINTKQFVLKNQYHILLLTCLVIAGLIIRLIILPYDIPITEDGSVYFWYAMDMSITDSFPENYNFPNNGWPSFLSLIFDISNSDNYLDYMNTQRITTVIISLITIIAVYYLCTHFFNKNYSLIGAAIFSFEPRLILDSLSGTNLTPFILLFVLSLLFFLSKNPKIILLSFVFTAFSTLVRYEGILLLIPLSIIYFNRFGKSPKKILHYIIMISIFILILTPIVHFRYQTDGNDGISSHIIGALEFFIGHESQVDTSPKNNMIAGDYIKNRNFSGYMDELVIWNKALSEEEVSKLFNNNGSPISINDDLQKGLLIYLPFEKISEETTTNNQKSSITSKCLEITSDTCKTLIGYSSIFELVPGKQGNSIKFDSNNSIKFDDGIFPFSSTPRSISMWVNPTSSSDYGNILYHSGMQQNEKVFEINTHLWGQNSISVGILSDDIYSQPNVLKLNEWNHITITFDGSDSFDTNTLKIFHNGNLLETNAASEQVILNDDVKLSTTPYFGFDLLTKYLLWISFPIFFLLLPYGLILFFKNRDYKTATIVLFGLVLALPALYAYFREFYEIKYLFYLYPIFTVISIYTVKKISEKIPNLKLLSLLIIVPIIFGSIAFIDFKKIDNEFEREAFQLTKIVLERTAGINESTHNISKYAATAESFSETELLPQKTSFELQRLSPYSSDNLLEFITNSKNSGLTHLVVDENTKPNFLNELFHNEEKFEYILKEFDSIEHGFTYHVKIFKIDFSSIPPQQ